MSNNKMRGGFREWCEAVLSVAGANGMPDDQVIPTFPKDVGGPELTVGMVRGALTQQPESEPIDPALEPIPALGHPIRELGKYLAPILDEDQWPEAERLLFEANRLQPESQEPVVHVFPDDLERLKNSECSATVYSVKMGDPHRGETVALSAGPQPAPHVPDSLRMPTEADAEKIADDCLCDDGTYRLAEVVGRLAEFMRAAPSIAEKREPSHYVVLDEEGQIQFSVAVKDPISANHAKTMMHEHINDAINGGIDAAKTWVVRAITSASRPAPPVSGGE